ncbi:MAG: P-II family nitrogen regulator [Candidatus Omnitrophota bacterium]
MKKIEAVIRPEKLDAVRQALEKVDCGGLMISEIEGHGKQKGVVQQWRGEKYRMELLPKMKVDIVVNDKDVDSIIKTIIKAAKTGEVGDGKIFISDIQDAVRIRTGEKGETAV